MYPFSDFLIYARKIGRCKYEVWIEKAVLVANFPQIFNTRHPSTGKVFNGYHASSKIKHGLSSFTVQIGKARGLSLLIGRQPLKLIQITKRQDRFLWIHTSTPIKDFYSLCADGFGQFHQQLLDLCPMENIFYPNCIKHLFNRMRH